MIKEKCLLHQKSKKASEYYKISKESLRLKVISLEIEFITTNMEDIIDKFFSNNWI
jgi:hypothetical protein